MFRAHMLIIRRSKLCYTASGIIALTGGRPVHGTVTCKYEDTRCCITQFWPPDDEHMCSKHVQAWNKLIVKKILCNKLVNYYDKYTEMHGQQNVKINMLVEVTTIVVLTQAILVKRVFVELSGRYELLGHYLHRHFALLAVRLLVLRAWFEGLLVSSEGLTKLLYPCVCKHLNFDNHKRIVRSQTITTPQSTTTTIEEALDLWWHKLRCGQWTRTEPVRK